MGVIIEVRNLEKNYKGIRALNGISFNVKKGEILCFLGPNGAGKSTTINILSTALGYDGGEIYFDGRGLEGNIKEVKKRLGIVPQDIAIYEEVSAEKNVVFFASLYGLRGSELRRSVEKALAFTGLLERKKDKPKTFSGGMKRRLNIACAIAHKPEVIIMDEPTVGIDPQSRNHILESVKELRNSGTTIIYTTHYMEEVEEISTRIIIMDHGSIIAEGTKEELKDRFGNEKVYYVDVDDSNNILEEELLKIQGVREVFINTKRIKISVGTGIENLDKIITLIMKKGIRISNITSASPSLEMVFLNLTGRNLRD